MKLKANCSLPELLDHPQVCLTHNLKVQARKMISEGEFRSAKELWDFKQKTMWKRATGLIK